MIQDPWPHPLPQVGDIVHLSGKGYAIVDEIVERGFDRVTYKTVDFEWPSSSEGTPLSEVGVSS